jgi:hypothetical protein
MKGMMCIMSLCFIIPIKLDAPDQSRYVLRCIESIRRVYTDETIVLAIAHNSLPLNAEVDANVLQVPNPFFSTFGCLALFHRYRYATTALILHDSAVVLGRLPPLQAGLQSVYHFIEPSLDRPRNEEGYKRLLTVPEWIDMTRAHTLGCFGNMIYIHQDAIEASGILRFIPLIKTKYDFECMERILPYIAGKNGVLVGESMCGSIFHPIADPWAHTEYATKTVDEFKRDGFPFVIGKCIVARK